MINILSLIKRHCWTTC